MAKKKKKSKKKEYSDESGTKTEAPREDINPFVYQEKLGVYEVIKMIFMTITFVPVRLILFILSFLFIIFFAFLSVVGTSRKQREEQPLSGCRRCLRMPGQACLRWCLALLGYWWIEQRGKADPNVRILTVAPHSSFIEALVMVCKHWPSAVSAAENAKRPLVGSIVKSVQAILVDRVDPESRHKAADTIIARAQSEDPWGKILIFPEGTCHNRKCLITFAPGAFRPGCPVQPVLVRYPNWFFDPAWVPLGPSLYAMMYRLMCQVFNRIQIIYLDAYYPSDAEKEDPALFARNVRDVMARELGVTTTAHTFEDSRLMHKAVKDKFPGERVNVEFGDLHRLYNYEFDDVKKLMDAFEKEDVDGDGLVGPEEFAKALHLPMSEPVLNTFAAFDTNGDGQISLREFLVGLATVNARKDKDDIIQYAFELFDKKGTGKVTRKTFVTMMARVFPESTKEELEELFRDVDTNDDGKITLDEFEDYASRHPEYVHVFAQTKYFARGLKAGQIRPSSENSGDASTYDEYDHGDEGPPSGSHSEV